MKPRRRSRRRTLRRAAIIYLVLLVTSTVVRVLSPPPPEPVGRTSVEVAVQDAGGPQEVPAVKLAWLAWRDGELVESGMGAPEDSPGTGQRLPLVLLHGSPGTAGNFRAMGPELARGRPVLAPDLPGFGASAANVPDFSVLAHARYVLEWMDLLGIERAHVLGYSMGGGVALHMWDLAPERVASVTMLASIGVQELELLGNYHLNHLVHGLQLVGLQALVHLTPHFGLLDHRMLDRAYARNFYDTDQRPLRNILRRFRPPMLVIHGERDPLVPAEAAVEHARLVPQSRLMLRPDSHFFPFRTGSGASETVTAFLEDVEAGEAPTRERATPSRIAAADREFDTATLPPWEGPGLLLVLVLIAAATFVSEDLTLIGTGLIVAQGRIDYLPAATAAFIGIVTGDLLLFWAGRALGRRIVRRRPFSWWISPQAIRESSRWLRRRGAVVILVTRVLPGTRLPTNVAAGVLRTSALRFLSYFTVAGIFWTFPVVWLVALLGEQLLPELGQWRWRILAVLAALGATMWLTRKLVIPLATWRGRRRLLGAWRLRSRWEFWPTAMIYLPLAPFFLWLGARYRGPTVFTAANPGIPAGGFVGESKALILESLPPEVVPAWVAVEPESEERPRERRLEELREFFRRESLSWPMVVKPDVGERGTGVVIARSWEDVDGMLRREPRRVLGQRFVEGEEFSVFWAKRPSEERGFVFSVTVKRPPVVVGDGRRTLYGLILADERAVALAPVYLEERPDARETVPAEGETVELTEVGAHCRGMIFEDGVHLISDELTAAVGDLAARFRRRDGGPGGFDFGRFDIITQDAGSLRAGRDLHVIELNGVTSESTNMYDRRHSLFDAWRILRSQWRLCYEIGAEQRERGEPVVGILQLLRAWRRART